MGSIDVSSEPIPVVIERTELLLSHIRSSHPQTLVVFSSIPPRLPSLYTSQDQRQFLHMVNTNIRLLNHHFWYLSLMNTGVGFINHVRIDQSPWDFLALDGHHLNPRGARCLASHYRSCIKVQFPRHICSQSIPAPFHVRLHDFPAFPDPGTPNLVSTTLKSADVGRCTPTFASTWSPASLTNIQPPSSTSHPVSPTESQPPHAPPLVPPSAASPRPVSTSPLAPVPSIPEVTRISSRTPSVPLPRLDRPPPALPNAPCPSHLEVPNTISAASLPSIPSHLSPSTSAAVPSDRPRAPTLPPSQCQTDCSPRLRRNIVKKQRKLPRKCKNGRSQ